MQHCAIAGAAAARRPPRWSLRQGRREQDQPRCHWKSCAECAPDSPGAVLTGPNFAHEDRRRPARRRRGGRRRRRPARARHRRASAPPAFRLYGNDDPVGAQVGGAAKNVIAIAAGAVIGAGLGENARAALVTRGLAELRRLAVALGGRPETVIGLSGLGDLLLTCTGRPAATSRWASRWEPAKASPKPWPPAPG